MKQPQGTINAAKLDTSPRLQRLLDLLKDRKEYTTLEIIHQANICAVSACVAELRVNLEAFGLGINCRRLDRNRYAYQLFTY